MLIRYANVGGSPVRSPWPRSTPAVHTRWRFCLINSLNKLKPKLAVSNGSSWRAIVKIVPLLVIIQSKFGKWSSLPNIVSFWFLGSLTRMTFYDVFRFSVTLRQNKNDEQQRSTTKNEGGMEGKNNQNSQQYRYFSKMICVFTLKQWLNLLMWIWFILWELSLLVTARTGWGLRTMFSHMVRICLMFVVWNYTE